MKKQALSQNIETSPISTTFSQANTQLSGKKKKGWKGQLFKMTEFKAEPARESRWPTTQEDLYHHTAMPAKVLGRGHKEAEEPSGEDPWVPLQCVTELLCVLRG